MLKVSLKLLGFCVGLGMILFVVKSQDDLEDISLLGYKLAEIERLQPRTVFIGSSRTYRHVNTALFDSLKRGGNSYNLGVQGGRALELHYLAERLMMYPYIETLVLEVRAFEPAVRSENRNTRRAYYHHDLRRARIGAKVALAANMPHAERWKAALERYVIALQNYSLIGQAEGLFSGPIHGWEPLPPLDEQGYSSFREEVQRAMSYASLLSTQQERGGLKWRVAEVQRRHEAFLSAKGRREFAHNVMLLRARTEQQPTSQDAVSANIWLELFQRLEARGVTVYFVEQIGEVEAIGVSNVLAGRLPSGRFIVLNDPTRYPDMYAPEYWFDIGHLTSEGARWVTVQLADQIP